MPTSPERPDDTMARIAKEQGVTVTTAHRRASRFLEARGLRFCAHYGYGNVIEHARAEWRKLRQQRKGTR